MKKMKVVYVAGPFRNKCTYQVEKNIRVAEEIGYQLACMGATTICPHTQGRFLIGTITEQYWIDATMNMLDRCDAMVVCPGWEESVGTLGERYYALMEGIPIFYWVTEQDEIAKWLEE